MIFLIRGFVCSKMTEKDDSGEKPSIPLSSLRIGLKGLSGAFVKVYLIKMKGVISSNKGFQKWE